MSRVRIPERIGPVGSDTALILAIFLIVGAIGLGVFGYSAYWSSAIVLAGTYALLAIGLNVVTGFSGLLDIGYAGFWAVGAYTTAILTGSGPWAPVRLDIWLTVPFAIAATVISGVVLGLVTLRVRGDYLAIVTLGFGEVVRVIALSWQPLTNGPIGISDIPHPGLFGVELGLDPRPYVLLVWSLVGLVALVVHNVWNSHVGRAMLATKTDELAAETAGVQTFRTKLLAFVLGAVTAGFVGVIYASYVGYVFPDNFSIVVAVSILAAVVIGGMGHMGGAAVGALLIILLPEVLRDFEQGRFLLFGAALVLMMTVRPQGLLPARPRRYVRSDGGSVAPSHLEIAGDLAPGSDAGAVADRETRTLLECRAINQRFGGLTALSDVSFDVPVGSIFAVIGPNGAGKSTLFDIITGVRPPTDGDVTLDDRSLTGLKPHNVTRLGVARTYQQIRLFGTSSAIENVLIGSDAHRGHGPFEAALRLPGYRKAERRDIEKAYDLLAFVGLSGRADARADSLSYGDQRRLEIARALGTRPRLLLLDEPAAGMNPAETEQLGELVEVIRQRGVTVLIVEHDMDLVTRISDQVMVLDRGVKIALGPASVISRDKAVIEAYLGIGA